ncbi:hypothetical protein HMPREF1625_00767 [Staphylococcus aureus 880]|nr:hypothetical protein HMPREF1625_00767 [Staphylococcus aureus 880]
MTNKNFVLSQHLQRLNKSSINISKYLTLLMRHLLLKLLY